MRELLNSGETGCDRRHNNYTYRSPGRITPQAPNGVSCAANGGQSTNAEFTTSPQLGPDRVGARRHQLGMNSAVISSTGSTQNAVLASPPQ